jgi:hypothetical protein
MEEEQLQNSQAHPADSLSLNSIKFDSRYQFQSSQKFMIDSQKISDRLEQTKQLMIDRNMESAKKLLDLYDDQSIFSKTEKGKSRKQILSGDEDSDSELDLSLHFGDTNVKSQKNGKKEKVKFGFKKDEKVSPNNRIFNSDQKLNIDNKDNSFNDQSFRSVNPSNFAKKSFPNTTIVGANTTVKTTDQGFYSEENDKTEFKRKNLLTSHFQIF